MALKHSGGGMWDVGTHLVILPHVDRGGWVLPGARLAGHPLPRVIGRGERPWGVGSGVLAWLCGELAVWSVLLVSIVGLWQQRKKGENSQCLRAEPHTGMPGLPHLIFFVSAVFHPQNALPIWKKAS